PGELVDVEADLALVVAARRARGQRGVGRLLDGAGRRHLDQPGAHHVRVPGLAVDELHHVVIDVAARIRGQGADGEGVRVDGAERIDACDLRAVRLVELEDGSAGAGDVDEAPR